MTQLVLPNTIDAGTEIAAAEHQGNYVAIRDLINGNLEGGSGAAGNIKAKGLTGRELDIPTVQWAGSQNLVQGVETFAALAITPGSGLQLNYAAGRAFITDDGSVHSSGTLLPANVASTGVVTVPSNSSGNPRIDRVIVTLTGYDQGTVSVITGTPTVGANLDNLTGAPAVPARAISLALLNTPNAYAGPYQATGTTPSNHTLRDNRLFAKPVIAAIGSGISELVIPWEPNNYNMLKLDYNLAVSDLGAGWLRVNRGSGAGGYSVISHYSSMTLAGAATQGVTNLLNNVSAGLYLWNTTLAGAGSQPLRVIGSSIIGTPNSNIIMSTSDANVSNGSGAAGSAMIEQQQIGSIVNATSSSAYSLMLNVGAGLFAGQIRIETLR